MAQTRTPLSRERIVQTAVELADRSGVDAVTMRRLGDELGFEAMSLYRYVASKDDLLDGMLDVVLAEWELPEESGDWRESVRTSGRSVHDALRRHPWSARLLMTGMRVRPARLEYMEWLLGRLRGAGFDADRTYSVYHLLDGFVFGFTLWEIAYTSVDLDDEEVVSRIMNAIPWDELPHLTEHRDQHMADGPHRDVRAFEIGLDLILDGLASTLGAHRPSATA
jgi:AcrR family transcriptional regulator